MYEKVVICSSGYDNGFELCGLQRLRRQQLRGCSGKFNGW